MKNDFLRLVVAVCFFALTGAAVAQSFLAPVVPNASESVEGNSASDRPFNQTGVRFQQVYGGSEFGLIPGWIRTIGFRVDISPQGGQDFFATLPDLQINLSTTSQQPDSLSPVFAENVGFNAMVVKSGALDMSGRNAHFPGQPAFFEAEIRLTDRFFYDPAEGNLLLDVRNFMGAPTTAFDAVDTFGDSVSSVFAIGVDSPSGTLSTVGLVTRFVIDPIPEPSTWALLIAGLAAFGVFRRTSRRRVKP